MPCHAGIFRPVFEEGVWVAGKVKVLPTSRVGIGPLAEMAEQLRAFVPGWEDTSPSPQRGRSPSDLRWDLEYLASHDANGILVASQASEVLGFVASFVRTRTLLVSQLWILPEVADQGVAESLFRRALLFGQRFGTQRTLFHALTPWQLALGLKFGLSPAFPLLRLQLSAEAARFLGRGLLRLLPGAEVTQEAVARRAFFADLERLDRLARGFARPMDHEYWLVSRGLRLAVVREGERITGYAYGGAGQCGPVVGATEESALAALGWALTFASTPEENPQAAGENLSLLLPASFSRALDQLWDLHPIPCATSLWLASELPRAGFFVPASLSLL
jgi:hypothetical protein